MDVDQECGRFFFGQLGVEVGDEFFEFYVVVVEGEECWVVDYFLLFWQWVYLVGFGVGFLVVLVGFFQVGGVVQVEWQIDLLGVYVGMFEYFVDVIDGGLVLFFQVDEQYVYWVVF